MKLKKKISIIIFFFTAIILFYYSFAYAGSEQQWKSLHYDVRLNKDGSMDVVETWNVWISETNTLFKSFNLNIYELPMKNVRVSQIENGQEKFLKQIYEQQYHVDFGCYYGLPINSSTYEIAWNVGLDNRSASRVYRMYYTVENVVEIHNDCTEFYWQFLSKNNGMYGDNITGRISLPKSVSNLEKLRIWGHGPLNAVINKSSNDLVTFSLDSIETNQILEVRIVTEENIYEQSRNFTKQYTLGNILYEEQNWADEANRQREEEKEQWYIVNVIFIIFIIINILFFILFLSKKKKYKIVGNELKEKYYYPKRELEYFRDIPDEKNASPARALYFYNFAQNKSFIDNEISKIVSATILNLSLKGLIKFEVKNEEIEIYMLKDDKMQVNFLTRDELMVFNILKSAIRNKEYITPKEFSEYASDNYEDVYKKLQEIPTIVNTDIELMNKVSAERKNILKNWYKKFWKNILFMFISIFFGGIIPALAIGFAILASQCSKNAKYVSILSEKGNEEQKEWKALKKYMEDYSLLNEKGVPDIVLWEKYLVYATVFGISEKVMAQLKLIHPEMFYMQTENNFNSNSYWHIMNSNELGYDHFEEFRESLENIYRKAQSAYSAAHYTSSSDNSSSGSGGGGGFSSGGGGRKRWWKLRWTLI